MRLKQRTINALLLLGSVLFFLIFLEITLVLFHPSKFIARPFFIQRYFCQYDRVLGWRNKPLTEGVFSSTDFSTYVTINSKGLRAHEADYEKPPGVRRIAVIGDSFAWGSAVDDNETFSEVLNRELTGTEVINMGCSGYGTDQSLLFLLEEGLKYQPDVVIYAFYGNDVGENGANISYGYPKPMFGLGSPLRLMFTPVPHTTEIERKMFDNPPTAFGKLKKFLRRNIHSYNFLVGRLNSVPFLRSLFLATGLGEEYTKKYAGLSYYELPSIEDKMDLTFALIREMRAVARLNGAGFLLVHIPGKEELPDARLGYKRIIIEGEENDVMAYHLRMFSDVNGVSYLDLLPAIRSAARKGVPLYHPMDDHFNAEGHRYAARAISGKLRDDNLAK